MNDTVANLAAALLEQEGQMSEQEIAKNLGQHDVAELRVTLTALVSSGRLRVSPRGNYYVSGHLKKSAVARPVRSVAGATIEFGVLSAEGTGFVVDGRPFAPGDVLSNQELVDIFRVGNTGGIRSSTSVGCTLLISSVDNTLYRDRWKDGVFNYTGEGRFGDQALERGNLTLADSQLSGTPLLLFFKRRTNHYEFQGQVRLTGKPFTEQQPDENGLLRRVWVFPLVAH